MLQQPSLQDCEALLSYIESSNSFYQELLGYKPEQTSLQEISESEWGRVSTQREFNKNSIGMYLPRNQTAIVRGEDPLSLFHEYFGHGLYCEQSLAGMKLIDLERRLLEEEKREFKGRRFTLNDIQKFRNQSHAFLELEEFRKQNLAQYELFAVWTEHMLSRKFGLNKEFEKKYWLFPKEERDAIGSVINFSERYGDVATFYAFGLRKIQDKKRLLKLSRDLFGKALERTRLIIHFGSGKPFSDIDLFVISNDIPSIYEDWIDIRAYNLQDIEEGIKVLNPMITDPLMIGNKIFGDENYLAELKQKVIAQQITEEAINFNLRGYEGEKRRSKDVSLGKYLQDKNLRSAKAFLTNALALKNGDKILTFNGFVNYVQKKISPSERFIELKGGIE